MAKRKKRLVLVRLDADDLEQLQLLYDVEQLYDQLTHGADPGFTSIPDLIRLSVRTQIEILDKMVTQHCKQYHYDDNGNEYHIGRDGKQHYTRLEG